ncbi:T9SS type A sorting domain-containing protein [bacterium]|nr:T9SS type A sorting domain-containing protein [bacterium]
MKTHRLWIGISTLLLTVFLTAEIVDPVIVISDASSMQRSVQVVYNAGAHEYLAVWEDMRNIGSTGMDIYGQFLNGDGSLRGDNFVICDKPGNQYTPHLDADPYTNRYLIVFEDERNYTGGMEDIYGLLLESSGTRVTVPNSEDDASFRISYDNSYVDYPSVAFNHTDKRYLVVWSDRRVDTGGDIYGQLVSDEGALLARSALAKTSAGVDNFPVGQAEHIDENVTDISYSPAVNEWLVVYVLFDFNIMEARILGQRVGSRGQLITQQGTEGTGPMVCSDKTENGAPCSWPGVQFNYEYTAGLAKAGTLSGLCEALVGWRAWNTADGTSNDLHAQRIGFFPDAYAVGQGWSAGPAVEGRFFAAFIGADGTVTPDALSGFMVSNAPYDQNHYDLAYSSNNHEFIMNWGDNRNMNSHYAHDHYCQILKINENSEIEFLDASHSVPVTSDENIPLSVDTTVYDGSSLYTGAAHNPDRNEFLLACTHKSDPADAMNSDIHGIRISGITETDIAADPASKPADYSLGQNYPNPFNGNTVIPFRLAESGHVILKLYNTCGQEIMTLVDDELEPGQYRAVMNIDGLTSGTYLYSLKCGTNRTVKKLTIVE